MWLWWLHLPPKAVAGLIADARQVSHESPWRSTVKLQESLELLLSLLRLWVRHGMRLLIIGSRIHSQFPWRWASLTRHACTCLPSTHTLTHTHSYTHTHTHTLIHTHTQTHTHTHTHTHPDHTQTHRDTLIHTPHRHTHTHTTQTHSYTHTDTHMDTHRHTHTHTHTQSKSKVPRCLNKVPLPGKSRMPVH